MVVFERFNKKDKSRMLKTVCKTAINKDLKKLFF